MLAYANAIWLQLFQGCFGAGIQKTATFVCRQLDDVSTMLKLDNTLTTSIVLVACCCLLIACHTRQLPSSNQTNGIVRNETTNASTAATPSNYELTLYLGRAYGGASDDFKRVATELYERTPQSNRTFLVQVLRAALNRGDYKTEATTMLQKLENNTPPKYLRNWAAEQIRLKGHNSTDTATWEGGASIAFEELPQCIKDLADAEMFLGAAIRRYQGHNYIVVRWGTPLEGFVGVVIAPKSLRVPPDMGYVTSRHDGVYAWHTTK